jgi:hypothetical protein
MYEYMSGKIWMQKMNGIATIIILFFKKDEKLLKAVGNGI